MTIYLLQFASLSIIFYIVYISLYNKHTFFNLRRWYLIGAMISSIVLPFISKLKIFIPQQPLLVYNLNTIEIQSQAIMQNVNSLYTLSYGFILLTIYISGITFILIKRISELSQIRDLINHGERKSVDNYIIVNNPSVKTPFSFFKYIVLNIKSYDQEDLDRILQHEKTHAKQWHSIDILFIEILCILFWFYPLLYLFKKHIKINHEYIADQHVVQYFSKRTYSYSLLKQSISNESIGKEIVFAHYLFHSFIKKRINMIFKEKSNPKSKLYYLFIIPMLFGIILGLSHCKNVENSVIDLETNTAEVKNATSDNEVFTIVEEMPRFPGCENEVDIRTRIACSTKKLMNFLSSNVTYPNKAKENGIEGTCIARFVVKTDGSISKLELLRDIGEGCGEATLSAIRAMNEKGIKWIPGIQNGEKVAVSFTLPMKFKLEEKS